MAKKLSHYDRAGRAKMVDVSDKPITARRAVAEALVAVNLTVTDSDARLHTAHSLAEDAAASALRALKAGP